MEYMKIYDTIFEALMNERYNACMNGDTVAKNATDEALDFLGTYEEFVSKIKNNVVKKNGQENNY